MHALLLAGELESRGLAFPGRDGLIAYFLRRRLFYRMDDPAQLVLYSRPGLRAIDAFFPIEAMRVSLPVLLDALAKLGVGRAPELCEAWAMLDAKSDSLGRVALEGTLAKPYLPKERVGKPGKWVTLYTRLAFQTLDATSSGIES
jgi:hypothetical protein